MSNLAALEPVLEDLLYELERADKHGPFNSAHEGWAVIREELDELWYWVRTREGSRHPWHMRREALQVAATAIRFARDLTPAPLMPAQKRDAPACSNCAQMALEYKRLRAEYERWEKRVKELEARADRAVETLRGHA